jgi:hypothetical protein
MPLVRAAAVRRATAAAGLLLTAACATAPNRPSERPLTLRPEWVCEHLPEATAPIVGELEGTVLRATELAPSSANDAAKGGVDPLQVEEVIRRRTVMKHMAHQAHAAGLHLVPRTVPFVQWPLVELLAQARLQQLDLQGVESEEHFQNLRKQVKLNMAATVFIAAAFLAGENYKFGALKQNLPKGRLCVDLKALQRGMVLGRLEKTVLTRAMVAAWFTTLSTGEDGPEDVLVYLHLAREAMAAQLHRSPPLSLRLSERLHAELQSRWLERWEEWEFTEQQVAQRASQPGANGPAHARLLLEDEHAKAEYEALFARVRVQLP